VAPEVKGLAIYFDSVNNSQQLTTTMFEFAHRAAAPAASRSSTALKTLKEPKLTNTMTTK
jgi:hypothetical protein